MELHILREHGRSFKGQFRVEVLKPNNVAPESSKVAKRRGQTQCAQCDKCYNNRSRPLFCNCGESLVNVKEKPILNAYKLSDSTFSVRKHIAGLSKRVIVNVTSRKCYSDECLETRAHYALVAQFNCVHLCACSAQKGQATVLKLELSKLSKFVQSKEQLERLKQEADKEEKISVFMLPDKNMALSSFRSSSHECISGFIHIDLRHLKCPLRKCSSQPRYHYHVKTQ